MGRAIRSERYRMVEWKKPGAPAETAQYELYDYQDGQIEKKNLADVQPAILAAHKAILARYPEAVRR